MGSADLPEAAATRQQNLHTVEEGNSEHSIKNNFI
jgi:hypothetical protein